jgi:hypothetical protein
LFLFVGRPCRWCWRRFFLEAFDLHDDHAHYESDKNKVKCALKEDPVADAGSSRRVGCGERWLWCSGQIDEHAHGVLCEGSLRIEGAHSDRAHSASEGITQGTLPLVFNSLLELVFCHAISQRIARDLEESAGFGNIAACAL